MLRRARPRLPLTAATSTAVAVAALLAACGGGGSGGVGTGTMRLSLTDAPACGYDQAFVTVERVRVHRSATAAEGDTGWSEVVLATPQRVDLLSLNNGTLLPLGQTELPAGTYTQLRLVLAPNSAADPLANAVVPTGGVATALTTPSGAQSGLKLNVNLTVPEGRVADFAIDFDACKSFVTAGKSGKVLLKPVLSVIPILSAAGQRIVGHLDPALVAAGATVSAQSAGAPVRATPPDASGRFVLYPVLAGSYDLVVTASGHVNAVMTGVPVADAAPTVIGSDSARLSVPMSATNHNVSGMVTVGGLTADTGATVSAYQALAGGPTIEVAHVAADADTGAYALRLPADAPVRLAWTAGATSFPFTADPSAIARYRLTARVPGKTAQDTDVVLTADRTEDFAFSP